MDYEIAIPSLGRPDILKNTTLKLLSKINRNRIRIFLKNDEERDKYDLDSNYQIVLTNATGIQDTRNFIRTFYYNHTVDLDCVFFIDDDIAALKRKSATIEDCNIEECLHYFARMTKKHNLKFFGICGYSNAFFLKDTISTNLKFIIGCFCGLLKPKENLITCSVGLLEDYEFSIKHYIKNGGVCRFNNFCVKTKFNFVHGGICESVGGISNRKHETRISAKFLSNQYSNYCRLIEKKNGNYDLRMKPTQIEKIIIQCLWVGPRLTRMEIASLRSFLSLGYIVHLYTYETVENVPDGVVIKDGNSIMPENEIFSLKDSYLPLSDIWRYKLLYMKGGIWADLDMIAIRKYDFSEPFIFSSERTIQRGAFKSILEMVPNIGIIKAPAGSAFFKDCYEKSLEFNTLNTNSDKLKYMKLFRKLIKKYNYESYVKPPSYFCNLDWWNAKEAYMVLDNNTFPTKYGVNGKSYNSIIEESYFIHFWRDRSTKKYSIDIDACHNPNTLWETIIHDLLTNL